MVLLDEVFRIEGAESIWINFGEWMRRESWHCYWEKGWSRWECAYCIGWVDGGREGSNCCMCRLLLDIGPPLSCHLSPSLNSWTVYSF